QPTCFEVFDCDVLDCDVLDCDVFDEPIFPNTLSFFVERRSFSSRVTFNEAPIGPKLRLKLGFGFLNDDCAFETSPIFDDIFLKLDGGAAKITKTYSYFQGGTARQPAPRGERASRYSDCAMQIKSAIHKTPLRPGISWSIEPMPDGNLLSLFLDLDLAAASFAKSVNKKSGSAAAAATVAVTGCFDSSDGCFFVILTALLSIIQ
uniref:Uncharacterized protein n=1 Tax=Romanomermis culicivorax TaxID=13658 RepID=A0A915KV14_ROMCU